MEIKFVGQGANLAANSSLAAELLEALSNENYHTFKCFVAFASPAGVAALRAPIIQSKAHINTFRVVVGIDQMATSAEALEQLLSWEVDVFVYNSRSRIIFHPKIYILEGNNHSWLACGSNNLTVGGLAENIEASIVVSSTHEDADHPLVTDVEAYFEGLLRGNNLERLTRELIAELLREGLIPTEMQRVAIQRQSRSASSGAEQRSALFPSIQIQPLPFGFVPVRNQRENSILEGLAVLANNQDIPVPVEVPQPEVPNQTVVNWTIQDNTEVLIAEIAGGGRWKQISFAKANFENFFNVPIIPGIDHHLNLKYIYSDGSLDDGVEDVKAIVKRSSNYNLEPEKVSESRIVYDPDNKPIIVVFKIDSRNFIYHFLTPGVDYYDDFRGVLAGNGIRRRQTTVMRLREEGLQFPFN